MTQNIWTAVDTYFDEALVGVDPLLEETLRYSDQSGLPAINVAPNQGKLLMMLAKSIGAKRILEVGTLGGYSTIWLARALPSDGTVLTLEVNADYATVARQNIARAGLHDRVTVEVGNAVDSLAKLVKTNPAPFDFLFIDADKENNTAYFEYALQLARVGSLIIVDNVVRQGEVTNPHSEDSRVQGVRRFIDYLAKEPRVTATTLQTVGNKGYDGFTMGLVIA